jgi:protease Do-like 1, chloroplastic
MHRSQPSRTTPLCRTTTSGRRLRLVAALTLLGATAVGATATWALSPEVGTASPARVVPPAELVEAPSPERPGAQPTRTDLSASELKTIDVFRRASPSVVHITRLGGGGGGLQPSSAPSGTGSGFLWDTRGHVVTNFHVIRGASGARITLADRRTYDAKLVGSAVDKDLAVLKIDAPLGGLAALPVATSSNLLVGQHVYAIGNPFGLDHTLSTGVISGLGREIKSVAGHPIAGVIQTDAAINPGNSGGPLLDSSGRLIGVNTAIFSPSGASAGVGFAVPADTVSRIVPQLIEHGKVVRPGLGIEILNGRQAGVNGVLVMGVMAGSGAETAGIQATRRDPKTGAVTLGDRIIALNGQAVTNTTDLFRALDRHRVGDTITVKVQRGSGTATLKVELQALSS